MEVGLKLGWEKEASDGRWPRFEPGILKEEASVKLSFCMLFPGVFCFKTGGST